MRNLFDFDQAYWLRVLQKLFSIVLYTFAIIQDIIIIIIIIIISLLFESLTLPSADITLHCQCDSLCNFLSIFNLIYFLFLMSFVAYSLFGAT